MPETIFHLLPRDVLRLTGVDRSSFIQGLISNDIGLCAPGAPIYAAYLTPQGKFLHDMFVTARDDAFLIDCESGRGADLLKRLMAHKLRAKISLEDVTSSINVWACLHSAPALPSDWDKDPRNDGLGYRALLPKDEKPAGEIATDNIAYQRQMISYAAPNGSIDLEIGASTIQEGNIDLLHGVSWTKGCYMGQELTARMHYRALVKKRLLPVRVVGVAPANGAPIMYKGAEIGIMRSHAGDMGLACLNLASADEARASGTPLTCGDNTLHVMEHLLGKA